MPQKKKKEKKILSVTEALETVKAKNMSPKEAFEFLRENSPKALVVMNPNRWEMEVKNPDFKVPITKKEIEDYNVFKQRLEKIKSTKDFDELEQYLKSNQFQAGGQGSFAMLGSNIIENAKKKGAKVIQNEDGSFSIFDDETTFRDTDASYAKPRTIYPDVKYTKSMYKKGNDIVNVYKTAALPEYKGRMPTEEEIADFQGGRYYTEALTPEMKKYYADVYFDPNNAKADLTYGINTNAEDIDRYAYARQLGEQIKPELERFRKRERLKQNIKDMFKGDGFDSGIGGMKGNAPMNVF
jgi:hypothetical protein